MKVDFDNAVLFLENAQLLRLRDAAGARLTCRGGTLWVTQEGVARDFFLGAGESLLVQSRGATLVEAMGRAGLSIGFETPSIATRATALRLGATT